MRVRQPRVWLGSSSSASQKPLPRSSVSPRAEPVLTRGGVLPSLLGKGPFLLSERSLVSSLPGFPSVSLICGSFLPPILLFLSAFLSTPSSFHGLSPQDQEINSSIISLRNSWDIRVSKRTIQKYMRQVRPKGASGQNWKTFLRNHATEMWACDFLHVPDLFFRPLFAFFIIELKSRKVIHVNVTRSPTDPWVAQQLREATPYGQTPTYLIRDNDRKFGPNFARVAASSGINILRTPYRTPQANAICERFLGSVRRECLDHFLILHEKQLHRLLKGYVLYFNQARPHQGLGQRIPDPPMLAASPPNQPNKVIAVLVLGGLHHDYQRAA